MELGPYQLQIFVSLIVILGAAFVALICDFLKGNNEQLRELTIELKIRREEEQKRVQMLMPQTAMALAAPAPAALPTPIKKEAKKEAGKALPERSVAPRALAAPAERRRVASSDALAAMERGEQLATSPARARASATAGRAPRQTTAARENRESVASMVESLMASRGASKAEPRVERKAIEKSRIEQKAIQENAQDTAAPLSPAKSMHDAPLPGRNWGAILSSQKQTAVPAVPAAPAATGDALPAGFQEGFVLSKLVKSRRPVSGLVVSIGVNAPKEADGSLPETVRALVQSLLGPHDFASQSSPDEFLLILPEEHGASAQRRLSQIAQMLWDFQLRSLGKYSILFSWGGIEVNSESIEEAIASASERMQETKRGRKILTMEPRGERVPLRKAV